MSAAEADRKWWAVDPTRRPRNDAAERWGYFAPPPCKENVQAYRALRATLTPRQQVALDIEARRRFEQRLRSCALEPQMRAAPEGIPDQPWSELARTKEPLFFAHGTKRDLAEEHLVLFRTTERATGKVTEWNDVEVTSHRWSRSYTVQKVHHKQREYQTIVDPKAIAVSKQKDLPFIGEKRTVVGSSVRIESAHRPAVLAFAAGMKPIQLKSKLDGAPVTQTNVSAMVLDVVAIQDEQGSHWRWVQWADRSTY